MSIVNIAVPELVELSSWQPIVPQEPSPGAPVWPAGAPELDLSGNLAMIKKGMAMRIR